MLTDVQKNILRAAAGTPSGQITRDKLKTFYTAKGDGQRTAMLVRRGLIMWVRRQSYSTAYAIMITDAGRAALVET